MTETLLQEHFIGSRRVRGRAVLYQVNPADPADFRVDLPEAGRTEVLDASAVARSAQAELVALGSERRSDALAAIARALVAGSDMLARLIARETGKVIGDAKGEVVRAARLFDFFAGQALRNGGERFESVRPGVTVEIDHRPVGVVAAITPWNFPIAIPAWKIAPAIAFSNTVLWKPSELSSATAAALMEIIADCGLPAGTVNLLLGGGRTGTLILSDGDIDAVSFTGSETTGAAVRTAAAARAIAVQAEMGGVNGVVILADADLDVAVEVVVNGAFFAAGQRCTATSRIIVEEQVADDVAQRLIERMRALKMGDPRAADTVVGPLVSLGQKQRILAQIRAVEATGHLPVIGGSGAQQPHAFVAPTLFVDAAAESALSREEIFGPVAAIFRATGFDHAIALLNDNRFGLSAGLCTRSLGHAEKFKVRARAGMKMINLPTAGVDYHAPFGGIGASSFGPREQGRIARNFFTRSTTTYQLPL